MSQATPAATAAPTVVLVHGAFADASGWAGVISRLQAEGIPVMAPANPLRSVSGDAAYIASVVNQIPGPVLLVGHSYGGVVISNASPQAANVVGLVYVCAFIPDEGEALQSSPNKPPTACSVRPCVPPSIRAAATNRGSSSTSTRHSSTRSSVPICRPSRRRSWPSRNGRLRGGFGEPSGPVGWKTLPSWALISPNDVTIGPSGERFMAERAGAEIVEVDASHVAMISQPQATTDLILTALGTIGRLSLIGRRARAVSGVNQSRRRYRGCHAGHDRGPDHPYRRDRRR